MISSQPQSILFFCIITFILSTFLTTLCQPTNPDLNPEFLNMNEDMSSLSSDRRLKASVYPQIRIYPDFTYLESAPSDFQNYIQNKLVPPVISWFQEALKVKYPVLGNFKLGNSVPVVCTKRTPQVLLTTGVSADFFVFFDSDEWEGYTVASSKHCFLSATTKRPLIATTIFNRNILIPPGNDVLRQEKNTYLLIHEMMHTLGFSTNAYEFFIDDNGNRRTGHIKYMELDGKNTTVIDVPPLTSRLRSFFGCESIPGAYMENDGGSGTIDSHFERRLFVYEAMSSGDIYGRRISEFSLALLEGTGWYIPNYKYAEPYSFGQGQGCDFIEGIYSGDLYETCQGNGRGCSPNGVSGGRCYNDVLANGHRYHLPEEHFHCENINAIDLARLPDLQVFGRGTESKCFSGSLHDDTSKGGLTTFCFKHSCSGEGQDTLLHIQVGDQSVTCRSAGEVNVAGYEGSINCPDPLNFCNTVGVQFCPRNCMGRGTCIGSRCECYQGFSGVDCGLNIE